MNCPLCLGNDSYLFLSTESRKYFRCHQCDYLYLDQKYYLSENEEKTKYDNHENTPDDLSYRKFLGRLLGPLENYLNDNSSDLDFGCGPGPTIATILGENNHLVSNYDYFYFNDQSLLDKKYDFITMTEVIEHLHNPMEVLTTLKKSLVKNGILGIMTKIYFEEIDFTNWYYRKDPTHIGFYTPRCLSWFEEYFQLEKVYSDNDNVIIFRNLCK